jgi:hypothetical protein
MYPMRVDALECSVIAGDSSIKSFEVLGAFKRAPALLFNSVYAYADDRLIIP